MMPCRAIRGATTVEENTAEAILSATKELLECIIAANGIEAKEVASAFFTVTPDLTAAFPARAARELGWGEIALLDALAPDVPGAPKKCVRILVHWNTDKTQEELVHVYLKGAKVLRPDIAIDMEG
ncbi:MAG: chorismate mutase [Anaerolineae bacterium]